MVSSSPTVAYIGLGANLGDPYRQIAAALIALAQLPHTRLLTHSRLYRTAPVEVDVPQPDYLNAVALLETHLDPYTLLEHLLHIERCHGRRRLSWHAPRTLDLDLLLYGDHHQTHPHLTLPHPRLTQRAFVLVPLLEIAPHCTHPHLGPLIDYLPATAHQPIEPLSLPLPPLSPPLLPSAPPPASGSKPPSSLPSSGPLPLPPSPMVHSLPSLSSDTHDRRHSLAAHPHQASGDARPGRKDRRAHQL
ncbi:MAG: 2-amino-4-hydroxy-6-hydroxymethyldihydropteridine diphosphokinase [Hydrogenophilus sp.]|nr:2-amino-4-hydroxy-6-hydroxymethyldihydropteridine diphosphokinase [Hydrogenophilus sp.]